MGKNPEVVAATEVGNLKIMQLKRVWSQWVPFKPNYDSNEFELNQSLFDLMGINFKHALQYLLQSQPSFAEFEQWCTALAGKPSSEHINYFNSVITNSSSTHVMEEVGLATEKQANVLTEEDLAFWDEYGYVILKSVIDKESCEKTTKLICEHIGADLTDPKTWHTCQHTSGIWVELTNHPQLSRNRQSNRLKKAYSQLWQRADIFPSIDQCGFNPPVTLNNPYKGQAIHLDVDFNKPLHFATQGILYLTDTTELQGALTVIPGFHKNFAQWLNEMQKAGVNNLQDFTGYQTKAIAANAGDFIIWHHHLPHGSNPNKEKQPRITQFINYKPIGPNY